MELKSLIISGLLVGLFIISIMAGYNQLVTDNISSGGHAQNLLLQNAKINSSYNSFFGNLSNVQTTANESKTAFEKESPSFTAGFLLFGSIIDFVKKITSSFIAIFGIFFDLLSSVTGIPSVVIGVISAIVIISLIFMAWKVYKVGE
jgi:hypothetical protein